MMKTRIIRSRHCPEGEAPVAPIPTDADHVTTATTIVEASSSLLPPESPPKVTRSSHERRRRRNAAFMIGRLEEAMNLQERSVTYK